MSASTYKRAKKVVDAATGPDATEAAKAALSEMDATGKVMTAYHKVRQSASLGPRSRPAAEPNAITNKRKQQQALADVSTRLSMLDMTLPLIDPIHPGHDPAEVDEWIREFCTGRAAIERFIKRMRGYRSEAS